MIDGIPGTEDFSFDDLGHVIGVKDRVYRATYDGTVETVVPDIGWAQGTQVLDNGDYVFVQSPKLTRISPEGSISTLSANTPSGNGITLDRDGFLYVSDDEVIRKVDPVSGATTDFARIGSVRNFVYGRTI